MDIKKNICKKNFILNGFIPFTFIIILLFLIILSFLPKPISITQRKLQSFEHPQGYSIFEGNTTNDKPKEELDLGTELTAGLIIFCLTAIYIISRLNHFPEYIRERKYDLYVFLYFANNGTLIASGINIINIFDPKSDVLYQILNYTPLFFTSLIYIIGGILIIVHKVKSNCDPEVFFSFDHLCEIAKLPCFVRDLIPLSDDCCMCYSYTGNDACLVCIWNSFIKFYKFISYVYSSISFYFFFIVFLIGWMIAKIIYLIVCCLSCKRNENNIQTNEPQVHSETQSGNQNINQARNQNRNQDRNQVRNQARNQARNQNRNQDRNQVRNQARNQARNQNRNQDRNQVRNQARNQARNQNRNHPGGIISDSNNNVNNNQNPQNSQNNTPDNQHISYPSEEDIYHHGNDVENSNTNRAMDQDLQDPAPVGDNIVNVYQYPRHADSDNPSENNENENEEDISYNVRPH